MEPTPEVKTPEAQLEEWEKAYATLQENYETENNNLANLELQEEDANDSIALIEDDIHILFENPVPDILEYKALKADLHLTLDGLKEIEETIKAKEALLDQMREGLEKGEKAIADIKADIAQNACKILPFKKEP